MTSNPYGLMNLLSQGDFITRSVAGILFCMSILSWYMIIRKSLQFKQLQRQASVANNGFWHAKNLNEGLALLGQKNANNPFQYLAEAGISAAAHHSQNGDGLSGTLNFSEWLTSCLRRSMDNINHNLQSGLSILASIGSTAPFVGLFGTVWGIYHALVGIGVSGDASIDRVAGPVGEALIMTAFGLAVAIPAVLAYNALTQGNKKIFAKIRNFAHDLHVCILTGERVGQLKQGTQA